MKTVIEHLNQNVKKFGSHIALEKGNLILTYNELDGKSTRLKNLLISVVGLQKGDIVGVLVPKSTDAIVIIIGLLKTGATIVLLDEKQPIERQKYILQNSTCKYLVTSLQKRVISESILWIDEALVDSNYHGKDHSVDIQAQDGAYIVYTSGTTGKPKGAIIDHAGLKNMAVCQANCYHISKDDRLAHFASYSFDAAIAEIFECLLGAATLVIPDTDDIKRDLLMFNSFLVNKNITFLTLTPSFLANLKPIHLSGLRMILVVGERLTENLVRRFINVVEIYNSYGVSECSICTTIYKFEKPFDGIVKIGRPIANTKILLLDINFNKVSKGQIGEIYIGGIGVAKGYINNEEQSALRFIKLEGQTGVFYKTGDLGKEEEDGNYTFYGRIDDQIKLRGIRIEPKEIEATLNQLDDITNSYVFARNNELNITTLLAFVEGNKSILNEETIKVKLRNKISSDKIPNRIFIIEKFPVAIGGKLNRKKLVDLLDNMFVAEEHEETDPLDKEIIQTFKKVLGIPYLALNGNVFDDYGCDSIQSIRLIVELEELLNIKIPSNSLYEFPVIREFIEYIHSKPSTTCQLADFYLSEKTKSLLTCRDEPENNCYLVTGGTSSLGKDLLLSLLSSAKTTVYCLVRGDSIKAVEDRIITLLETSRKFNLDMTSRLKVVLGDISKDSLGLEMTVFDEICRSVSKVFHLASEVNHFIPFEQLISTNVEPIEKLVYLCCTERKKKLIFISSCSVFLASTHEPTFTYDEKSSLTFDGFSNSSGYSVSKFVSEEILRNLPAGLLDYQIHRLDIIVSQNNVNSSQWLDILFRVCEEYELAFTKDHLQITISPASSSEIASAIHKISVVSTNMKVYHLFPKERFSLGTLLSKTFEQNKKMNYVSFEEWHEKISAKRLENHEIDILIAILDDIERTSKHMHICSTKSNAILEEQGFIFSPFRYI